MNPGSPRARAIGQLSIDTWDGRFHRVARTGVRPFVLIRHNRRKWCIGIPLVFVFAVILWPVLGLPGLPTAFLATVASTIIISVMPTYIIVSPGVEQTPGTTPLVHPLRKESRWFLTMLFALVAVILGILIYSIWTSLR